MNILAFDPYLSEDKAKELNVTRATVDEIAEQADFVTVHTPLTPKTRGIVDKAFLKKQNRPFKLSMLRAEVSLMKMRLSKH